MAYHRIKGTTLEWQGLAIGGNRQIFRLVQSVSCARQHFWGDVGAHHDARSTDDRKRHPSSFSCAGGNVENLLTLHYLGGGEEGRDEEARPSTRPLIIRRGVNSPSGRRVKARSECCAHRGPITSSLESGPVILVSNCPLWQALSIGWLAGQVQTILRDGLITTNHGSVAHVAPS